ncbi:MAG: N-acetylmuramoyl-L-alanine amidase [Gammaproteobacteria bacterium]
MTRLAIVKTILVWLVCSVMLSASYSASTSGSQLGSLRISKHRDKTRIVIHIKQNPQFNVFVLSQPDRLVLDLKNIAQPKQWSIQRSLKSAVKAVRHAVHDGDLRVVFDLNDAIKPHSFVLNPDKLHKNYRLVIDVYASNVTIPASAKPAVSNNVKVVKPSQPKAFANLKLTDNVTASQINPTVKDEKAKQISLSQAPKQRNVIVVIDPGHGGKDPGAIGRRGTKEKNVVLAISKYLKREIDQQPGMQAVLTRSGDYYISLRQRLNLARRYKADIFVAIHADAFKNARSQGSSIYALSERGASSEAARWLAAKENYSELGEVQLSNKSNLLRSVLISLSQTATIRSSLKLGSAILHELDDFTKLHHDEVEQAPFVVLKSPDIPSILIETGFISNLSEEARLSNSSYQRKLASSITQGIQKYFQQYPPKNSWFANPPSFSSKRYTIKSGDNLKLIARQFNISVVALKKANKLKGENPVIYPGQQLTIPN